MSAFGCKLWLIALSAIAIPPAAAGQNSEAENADPVAVSGGTPSRPIQVDYPPVSIEVNEEGDVGVRYLVKEDGSVGDVQIVRSSGSARLDEAAIPIVKRWRYKPGMEGGKPVAVWLTATVRFRLH